MMLEMTLDQLLKWVTTERAAWDDLLQQAGPQHMLVPGPGGWTLKDISAHLAWFEAEMVQLLQTHALEKGSDLWNLATDERNQAIYEQNRDRALGEVLAWAEQVYAALLAELNTLSDADLQDPARLGMPPEWVPWQILAGNTYEHYRAHAADARAWVNSLTA